MSDSTTLFGFYNSIDSIVERVAERWAARVRAGRASRRPQQRRFPFLSGDAIEGRVEQICRRPPVADNLSRRPKPRLEPGIRSRGRRGQGCIVVALAGRSSALDLAPGDENERTKFDRFGIITTWIDGNSQDVYLDDIAYTVRQE